ATVAGGRLVRPGVRAGDPGDLPAPDQPHRGDAGGADRHPVLLPHRVTGATAGTGPARPGTVRPPPGPGRPGHLLAAVPDLRLPGGPARLIRPPPPTRCCSDR